MTYGYISLLEFGDHFTGTSRENSTRFGLATWEFPPDFQHHFFFSKHILAVS